jgi:hypothetical protein
MNETFRFVHRIEPSVPGIQPKAGRERTGVGSGPHPPNSSARFCMGIPRGKATEDESADRGDVWVYDGRSPILGEWVLDAVELKEECSVHGEEAAKPLLVGLTFALYVPD